MCAFDYSSILRHLLKEIAVQHCHTTIVCYWWGPCSIKKASSTAVSTHDGNVIACQFWVGIKASKLTHLPLLLPHCSEPWYSNLYCRRVHLTSVQLLSMWILVFRLLYSCSFKSVGHTRQDSKPSIRCASHVHRCFYYSKSTWWTFRAIGARGRRSQRKTRNVLRKFSTHNVWW